jgi:hypothetical protein
MQALSSLHRSMRDIDVLWSIYSMFSSMLTPGYIELHR